MESPRRPRPCAPAAPRHPRSPSTAAGPDLRFAALATALLVPALLAAALLASWPVGATSSAAPAGRPAAASSSYLPHLVSGGPPPTATPYGTPPVTPTWSWPWPTRRPPRAPGAQAEVASVVTPVPRTSGMISFGESVVELQNLTDDTQSVSLKLHSLDLFDDVPLTRSIAPMSAISVELRSDRRVTYSNYAAHLTAPGAVGALARTEWLSGAMEVYEAAEPSAALILPLFALEVYSHTTILQVTNTSPDSPNSIDLTIFDADGSWLAEWNFSLDPGESGPVDPMYPAEFRGLSRDVGGGFLGTMWIAGSLDTAVVAYGDEYAGIGASGFGARPVAAADTVQVLPKIRANVGGDSLISIANTVGRSVDVTIDYVGAADSPSGAGRTYSQSFEIGPRHWAIVDLDLARARGDVVPPALPRGADRDQGFIGSATIRASSPVLAMVLDQDARPIEDPPKYTVASSAAYNAFGPKDLAATWIVPRAYGPSSVRHTEVAVVNPGTAPATFRVEWGVLPDDLTGTSGPITLAPGQVATVGIVPTGAEDVQAVVRADAPVAVVAYDAGQDLDTTAYWPLRVTDGLVDSVPTVVSAPTSSPTPAPPTPSATAGAPTTPPPGPAHTGTPTTTRTTMPVEVRASIYLPTCMRNARP